MGLKAAKEQKTKDEETIKKLEMQFFKSNLQALELDKQLNDSVRSEDIGASSLEILSRELAKDADKPSSSSAATTSLNFDFLSDGIDKRNVSDKSNSFDKSNRSDKSNRKL